MKNAPLHRAGISALLGLLLSLAALAALSAPDARAQVPDHQEAATAEAAPEAPPGPLSPAPDPALLERVMENEQVVREERAEFGDYLRGFREALFGRLFGWLASNALIGAIAQWVLLIIVAVAVLGVVFLIVRMLLARRWTPAAGLEEQMTTISELPEAPDRARELEALLTSGPARAALGALWRWLSERAASAKLVDGTRERTNRELVEALAAGAPALRGLDELRALAHRSDPLLYAREEPALGEVRELVRRAREAAP